MRLLRNHDRPHFECVNGVNADRCEDGASDEPGFRHICSCSCKRCSITVSVTTASGTQHIEVCICPDCDARECGLHRADAEPRQA